MVKSMILLALLTVACLTYAVPFGRRVYNEGNDKSFGTPVDQVRRENRRFYQEDGTETSRRRVPPVSYPSNWDEQYGDNNGREAASKQTSNQSRNRSRFVQHVDKYGNVVGSSDDSSSSDWGRGTPAQTRTSYKHYNQHGAEGDPNRRVSDYENAEQSEGQNRPHYQNENEYYMDEYGNRVKIPNRSGGPYGRTRQWQGFDERANHPGKHGHQHQRIVQYIDENGNVVESTNQVVGSEEQQGRPRNPVEYQAYPGSVTREAGQPESLQTGSKQFGHSRERPGEKRSRITITYYDQYGNVIADPKHNSGKSRQPGNSEKEMRRSGYTGGRAAGRKRFRIVRKYYDANGNIIENPELPERFNGGAMRHPGQWSRKHGRKPHRIVTIYYDMDGNVIEDPVQLEALNEGGSTPNRKIPYYVIVTYVHENYKVVENPGEPEISNNHPGQAGGSKKGPRGKHYRIIITYFDEDGNVFTGPSPLKGSIRYPGQMENSMGSPEQPIKIGNKTYYIIYKFVDEDGNVFDSPLQPEISNKSPVQQESPGKLLDRKRRPGIYRIVVEYVDEDGNVFDSLVHSGGPSGTAGKPHTVSHQPGNPIGGERPSGSPNGKQNRKSYHFFITYVDYDGYIIESPDRPEERPGGKPYRIVVTYVDDSGKIIATPDQPESFDETKAEPKSNNEGPGRPAYRAGNKPNTTGQPDDFDENSTEERPAQPRYPEEDPRRPGRPHNKQPKTPHGGVVKYYDEDGNVVDNPEYPEGYDETETESAGDKGRPGRPTYPRGKPGTSEVPVYQRFGDTEPEDDEHPISRPNKPKTTGQPDDFGENSAEERPAQPRYPEEDPRRPGRPHNKQPKTPHGGVVKYYDEDGNVVDNPEYPEGYDETETESAGDKGRPGRPTYPRGKPGTSEVPVYQRFGDTEPEDDEHPISRPNKPKTTGQPDDFGENSAEERPAQPRYPEEDPRRPGRPHNKQPKTPHGGVVKYYDEDGNVVDNPEYPEGYDETETESAGDKGRPGRPTYPRGKPGTSEVPVYQRSNDTEPEDDEHPISRPNKTKTTGQPDDFGENSTEERPAQPRYPEEDPRRPGRPHNKQPKTPHGGVVKYYDEDGNVVDNPEYPEGYDETETESAGDKGRPGRPTYPRGKPGTSEVPVYQRSNDTEPEDDEHPISRPNKSKTTEQPDDFGENSTEERPAQPRYPEEDPRRPGRPHNKQPKTPHGGVVKYYDEDGNVVDNPEYPEGYDETETESAGDKGRPGRPTYPRGKPGTSEVPVYQRSNDTEPEDDEHPISRPNKTKTTGQPDDFGENSTEERPAQPRYPEEDPRRPGRPHNKQPKTPHGGVVKYYDEDGNVVDNPEYPEGYDETETESAGDKGRPGRPTYPRGKPGTSEVPVYQRSNDTEPEDDEHPISRPNKSKTTEQPDDFGENSTEERPAQPRYPEEDPRRPGRPHNKQPKTPHGGVVKYYDEDGNVVDNPEYPEGYDETETESAGDKGRPGRPTYPRGKPGTSEVPVYQRSNDTEPEDDEHPISRPNKTKTTGQPDDFGKNSAEERPAQPRYPEEDPKRPGRPHNKQPKTPHGGVVKYYDEDGNVVDNPEYPEGYDETETELAGDKGRPGRPTYPRGKPGTSEVPVYQRSNDTEPEDDEHPISRPNKTKTTGQPDDFGENSTEERPAQPRYPEEDPRRPGRPHNKQPKIPHGGVVKYYDEDGNVVDNPEYPEGYDETETESAGDKGRPGRPTYPRGKPGTSEVPVYQRSNDTEPEDDEHPISRPNKPKTTGQPDDFGENSTEGRPAQPKYVEEDSRRPEEPHDKQQKTPHGVVVKYYDEDGNVVDNSESPEPSNKPGTLLQPTNPDGGLIEPNGHIRDDNEDADRQENSHQTGDNTSNTKQSGSYTEKRRKRPLRVVVEYHDEDGRIIDNPDELENLILSRSDLGDNNEQPKQQDTLEGDPKQPEHSKGKPRKKHIRVVVKYYDENDNIVDNPDQSEGPDGTVSEPNLTPGQPGLPTVGNGQSGSPDGRPSRKPYHVLVTYLDEDDKVVENLDHLEGSSGQPRQPGSFKEGPNGKRYRVKITYIDGDGNIVTNPSQPTGSDGLPGETESSIGSPGQPIKIGNKTYYVIYEYVDEYGNVFDSPLQPDTFDKNRVQPGSSEEIPGRRKRPKIYRIVIKYVDENGHVFDSLVQPDGPNGTVGKPHVISRQPGSPIGGEKQSESPNEGPSRKSYHFIVTYVDYDGHIIESPDRPEERPGGKPYRIVVTYVDDSGNIIATPDQPKNTSSLPRQSESPQFDPSQPGNLQIIPGRRPHYALVTYVYDDDKVVENSDHPESSSGRPDQPESFKKRPRGKPYYILITYVDEYGNIVEGPSRPKSSDEQPGQHESSIGSSEQPIKIGDKTYQIIYEYVDENGSVFNSLWQPVISDKSRVQPESPENIPERKRRTKVYRIVIKYVDEDGHVFDSLDQMGASDDSSSQPGSVVADKKPHGAIVLKKNPENHRDGSIGQPGTEEGESKKPITIITKTLRAVYKYIDEDGNVFDSIPSEPSAESSVQSGGLGQNKKPKVYRIEVTYVDADDNDASSGGKVDGRIGGSANGNVGGKVGGGIDAGAGGNVGGKVEGRIGGTADGNVGGKVGGGIDAGAGGNVGGKVEGRIGGTADGNVGGKVGGGIDAGAGGNVGGKVEGRIGGTADGNVGGKVGGGIDAGAGGNVGGKVEGRIGGTADGNVGGKVGGGIDAGAGGNVGGKVEGRIGGTADGNVGGKVGGGIDAGAGGNVGGKVEGRIGGTADGDVGGKVGGGIDAGAGGNVGGKVEGRIGGTADGNVGGKVGGGIDAGAGGNVGGKVDGGIGGTADGNVGGKVGGEIDAGAGGNVGGKVDGGIGGTADGNVGGKVGGGIDAGAGGNVGGKVDGGIGGTADGNVGGKVGGGIDAGAGGNVGGKVDGGIGGTADGNVGGKVGGGIDAGAGGNVGGKVDGRIGGTADGNVGGKVGGGIDAGAGGNVGGKVDGGIGGTADGNVGGKVGGGIDAGAGGNVGGKVDGRIGGTAGGDVGGNVGGGMDAGAGGNVGGKVGGRFGGTTGAGGNVGGKGGGRFGGTADGNMGGKIGGGMGVDWGGAGTGWTWGKNTGENIGGTIGGGWGMNSGTGSSWSSGTNTGGHFGGEMGKNIGGTIGGGWGMNSGTGSSWSSGTNTGGHIGGEMGGTWDGNAGAGAGGGLSTGWGWGKKIATGASDGFRWGKNIVTSAGTELKKNFGTERGFDVNARGKAGGARGVMSGGSFGGWGGF